MFGFAFGAGLLVRILWLFRAPGSGSWRDLLPVTSGQWRTLLATARHYLSGFRGEAPVYRAHNPLAGIVYTVFFLVGASQVITGASLYIIGEDNLKEAVGQNSGARLLGDCRLRGHPPVDGGGP